MENISNEADVEDSLNIASKEWNRIIDAAKKSGYREGVEDGSNSVFQEGFDQGYKEGFQTAFLLGKFKSLLNIISQNTKHSQNINDFLDKTRSGACHICVMETGDTNGMQMSFLDIINKQRIYSVKVLQTLYQYFQLYVNDINITQSDILKIENHIPKDN